ncbi:MAG TPA: hypothetical protein VFJ57_02110 [Solirubrobacterales bacterium]|nr:hypothetical protein [Solirubrobacterales bacterium]
MNRKAKFALVLAISLAASLSAAVAARAATVIGQLPAPYKFATCAGALNAQTVVPAGTTPYTVPAGGGVITSWQTTTAADSGTAKLKVLRPTGAAGQFTVVAEDGPRPVLAGTSPTFTGVRIPVQGGDTIGLVGQGVNCLALLIGMPYRLATFNPTDPSLGGSAAVKTNEWEWGLDLRATVEPDADGDGFGDETQDFCPVDGAAQLPPCTVATPAPVAIGTGSDQTPPALRLRGRNAQDALRRGGVVEVASSDEAADLSATGSLRIAGVKRSWRLNRVAEPCGASAPTRLLLTLPKAAKRAVRTAVRHGRRVSATVSVTAVDAAANSARVTRTVAIARPKKH